MSDATATEARAGQRLDAFPYRHRLAEVMVTPLCAPPGLSLGDAARLMLERGTGSLLVEAPGGQVLGIVTEHDAMKALARHPGDPSQLTIREVMSAPIATMSGESFVYRALGRMGRLGYRHLGVTDAAGRIVGIVSARLILRRRVGGGLTLGDAIDAAADGAALAAARAELPELAQRLLDEGLQATEVAALLSATLCDITARAAQLAAAETERERGPAPAPWCVLVLGSGGRGESLLSADQDNAIIHAAGDDGWYAAVGQRMADLLDQAGIPYCKGGVMAARPGWRGDPVAWRTRVAEWLRRAQGEALLDVDIFFDFRAVSGERALAASLRADALAAAKGAPAFLRQLAEQASSHGAALSLLGRFRLQDGRVDLKAGGLLPLVGAARVLALANGIGETETAARLRAAADRGKLSGEDLERLLEARAVLTETMLRQQLADIAAGRAPSSKIDPRALSRTERTRLKEALGAIRLIPDIVRGALAAA
ncbi:putative nucleotidyltransferase substrate binding domain-containing protein [Desertibaculum subflavum]|uniref:putative nucleotidyltransferase substrate binding domain-containing protein n=1 Tax=Desertibaculum subflavum TaxID=2268458 RepID=UPI000E672115